MAITSKDINLEQLDKELGSKGLIADFNNPEAKIILPADESDVTELELQTAIDKHIAQLSSQEIVALNREQGILKLKELGFSDEQITALLNG